MFGACAIVRTGRRAKVAKAIQSHLAVIATERRITCAKSDADRAAWRGQRNGRWSLVQTRKRADCPYEDCLRSAKLSVAFSIAISRRECDRDALFVHGLAQA